MTELGGPDRLYNDGMSLPLDTSRAAARLQVELWRRMSPQEKLRLASRMTQAAREFCLAGIRHRHPEASEEELKLRFAWITLGPELAAKAYPEAAILMGHVS
ncbi:MAG TPA: hypothetical protein VNI57_11050 [Candidatus Saccharimonadales bacterium]|nr:hypothetical protein [Candidatus Saccharimonadales bacterium]